MINTVLALAQDINMWATIAAKHQPLAPNTTLVYLQTVELSLHIYNHSDKTVILTLSEWYLYPQDYVGVKGCNNCNAILLFQQNKEAFDMEQLPKPSQKYTPDLTPEIKLLSPKDTFTMSFSFKEILLPKQLQEAYEHIIVQIRYAILTPKNKAKLEDRQKIVLNRKYRVPTNVLDTTIHKLRNTDEITYLRVGRKNAPIFYNLRDRSDMGIKSFPIPTEGLIMKLPIFYE